MELSKLTKKSLRWKRNETLADFYSEISGNFPVKGQKISFQIVCLLETVDKTYIKQIKVTVDV
jgi:hypothetical protein